MKKSKVSRNWNLLVNFKGFSTNLFHLSVFYNLSPYAAFSCDL